MRYQKAEGPLPRRRNEPSSTEELQAELPSRYQIIRMIGRGGMGVVFQCMDNTLDRPVAIKMMLERYNSDRRAQRRFLREARTQAVINHINVARVLNVGLSPQDRPFIVMELVDGKDLRQIIREHPDGMDPELVCNLIGQACEGLAEAHAEGIIHRDLKPSNLMVLRDHRNVHQLKVLDLGLAKIVGGRTDLKTITVDTAGLLIGTPAYMSPEQVSGASVDPRADIYALGVVLFEMLTGRLPFESETVEGWLYKHLHTEPKPPSSLRPVLKRYFNLDNTVMKALAKAPEGRPQDVRSLALMLDRTRAAARTNPALRAVMHTVPILHETTRIPQQPPGPAQSMARAAAEPRQIPVPAPMKAAAMPEQPASKPMEEEPDRKQLEMRRRYEDLAHSAELAEDDRRWDVAIQKWTKALKFAEDVASVRTRIDSLQRELRFEKTLAESATFAATGDWSRATDALEKAAVILPSDPRVVDARNRLPRRLVEAWLEAARVRLNSLPPGPAQQGTLRRLSVLRARMGDMSGALRLLQEETSDPAARIIGLAQASVASIRAGRSEGLRPYLDRGMDSAKQIADPETRGRTCLELGRALGTYGDAEAAAEAFRDALSAFMRVGKRKRHTQLTSLETGLNSSSVMTSGVFSRRPRTTRMVKDRSKNSREYYVAEVSRAQAESGLAEDAISTAGLINDSWTKSETLAQVAEALARNGRPIEAERVAEGISFSLPKAQAWRAIAIAHVYAGNIHNAETMLKDIASPEQKAPVQGFLAAAWVRHGNPKRAVTYVQDALGTAFEVPGIAARIETLIASADPLLGIGDLEHAEPLLGAATSTIDGADDATERLQGFLQLARARERGRSANAINTVAAEDSDIRQSDLLQTLRRALEALRSVQTPQEREECLESLATAIAAADAHDLAGTLLAQAQNEVERALTYLGFASGAI